MPAALVKTFAKRAGVPVARAEHLWDKAKAQVKSEYGLGEPTGGSDATRYWRLVVGIVKKMMKLEDAPPRYPSRVVTDDMLDELRAVGRGDVADALAEV